MDESTRLGTLRIALRIVGVLFVLGIMAVQSVANPEHVGHSYGDVPALFLVAAVLGGLSPAAARVRLGAAVA